MRKKEYNLAYVTLTFLFSLIEKLENILNELLKINNSSLIDLTVLPELSVLENFLFTFPYEDLNEEFEGKK